MTSEPILRVVSKALLPYILLFAFYVQFHGDFGPGGGFQAGVILGAGIILYSLVFGLDAGHRAAPPWLIEKLVALGVLIYLGVGVVALLRGGQYLDYSVLEHEPQHGQHLGIFLVELGVGITVSAVMVSIFFQFAGRRRSP